MTDSGLCRLHRVTAFVDPVVDAQSLETAGGTDELPQPGGVGPRVGSWVEAALDHRQVEQVLRHSRLTQDGNDDVTIATGASMPRFPGLPTARLEEVNAGGDLGVGVNRQIAVRRQLVDANQRHSVGGEFLEDLVSQLHQQQGEWTVGRQVLHVRQDTQIGAFDDLDHGIDFRLWVSLSESPLQVRAVVDSGERVVGLIEFLAGAIVATGGTLVEGAKPAPAGRLQGAVKLLLQDRIHRQ